MSEVVSWFQQQGPTGILSHNRDMNVKPGDQMAEEFWNFADTLVTRSRLVIDRPKGSIHPQHPEAKFPLDYGYLQGTVSGDGSGIDVWVGSLGEKRVTAIVCTIDLAKSDAELKLLIGCTPEEHDLILKMHNRGSQSAILVRRHSQ